MKIRSTISTLRVYDLPGKQSLHLAGRAVSRDLTDEEFKSPDIQKAISPRYKWARVVKEKAPTGAAAKKAAVAPKSAPAKKDDKPVAKSAESVTKAEPNTGSDS